MNLRDAAQQALDGLIESARLLGAAQAKKLYGCYSQEDGRLERAWHENIAKRSATIRAALAEPQPQPEPVQEPYGYIYEYDGVFGLHREFYPRPYNGMKPTRTVPVYTTPPQRQPLTEKEVDDCWYQSGGLTLEFARALEKAHGIGGDK